MEWAAFARDYGTLILTVTISFWGVVWTILRWALGKQFATKADIAEIFEKMAELARVLRDEDSEQDKRLVDLKHRLELQEKDIRGMPGFTEHNRLRDDMGAIKEQMIAAVAKLDMLHKDVEGINELLRQR